MLMEKPSHTSPTAEMLALAAFKNAAKRVPAYQTLLRESGTRVEEIQTIEDFHRLPVLGKHDTFQRFGIEELCVNGILGRPGTVLTSSGHSGVFAFGLTDRAALASTVKWIDDALDMLFDVRSRPTLLINCLPMGVKVHTQACTLAETSVRPDMAVALVKAFGRHFAQFIVVAEAAFAKLVLENGKRSGIDWSRHAVNIILGEEPLAENARRYLGKILGHDISQPEKGMIVSSMGVAELGLNLFFEVPPVAPLILLRRALHEDASLRDAVLGGAATWVPSLFTYDPRRIFVECDASGRLILTTLDQELPIPLIRYATGDQATLVRLPLALRPALEAQGIAWESLHALPIVAIHGRGHHALAGDAPVYPEAVKEGIYHDPELAELTTANFRLVSGDTSALVRIQLSPDVRPTPEIQARFQSVLSKYVRAPYVVRIEAYEDFGSGMALDYERKFSYLRP
jgi:phenylacetate-CoA ligase